MKDEFLKFRITEELKDRLKDRAAINKRKMNQEIEYLIERGLEVVEHEAGLLESVKSGKTNLDPALLGGK